MPSPLACLSRFDNSIFLCTSHCTSLCRCNCVLIKFCLEVPAPGCTCTNLVYKHVGACNLGCTKSKARYAMRWCVTTLLLISVAIMTSVLAASPAQGLRGLVTRFVCAKCTETSQLSSQGLFLSRAAVLRHMAASKPCFTAKLGFSGNPS